ncbi:Uncharacterized protein FWK35_00023494 [Aphis craccivora]|uniref:Secreted protein n=1 Tax=Aphis craccivora TaxID=307492 RepID=A0A6G0YMP1_APHCR|nr:Uncharacterized protein FWK35_00023494 [Aphis craccivora]
MLCVFFFLCLCTRESISIHFLNFSIVFKSAGKTKKKIKEKREFLRKTSFRPNRFFYMVVTQKLITVNSSNFHQIFMSV